LDEFGIESKVIGNIEYHWQHLIIVPWQNVTYPVAYWTEVCLYEDAIGENTCKKNWLVLLNAFYAAYTAL